MGRLGRKRGEKKKGKKRKKKWMQVPGWKKKRKENVALFRSQRFEKEARESVKSREKKDFKSLTNESHVVSLLIGGTARVKKLLDSRMNGGMKDHFVSLSTTLSCSGKGEDFLNEPGLCSRFNGSSLAGFAFDEFHLLFFFRLLELVWRGWGIDELSGIKIRSLNL